MAIVRAARIVALTVAVGALSLPAAAGAAPLDLSHESTVVSEIGIGDGIISPGDALAVTETVHNSQPGPDLTGVNGTLATGTPNVTIPQAISPFASFGFAGSGSNSTPYHVQLGGGFECGQNVGLSLGLIADQGTATIPFQIGSGVAAAPTDRASVNVPLAIPDGGTIVASLPISAAGRVKSVAVHIGKITHTYDGDLTVTLIAPDGTRVTLVDQRGGSSDNFVNTTVTAAQGSPIATGTAPFSGTFTSEGDIDALIGHQQQGTWKLEVHDNHPSDVGTI